MKCWVESVENGLTKKEDGKMIGGLFAERDVAFGHTFGGFRRHAGPETGGFRRGFRVGRGDVGTRGGFGGFLAGASRERVAGSCLGVLGGGVHDDLYGVAVRIRN